MDAKTIEISGAREHNLKNIHVDIPKNKFVVVTGVSGSGKSSLIIDTLFAEGQRRYVESLSSYARQFLNRMQKPDVDYIKGLCPAIALEQKVVGRSSRSTVGSLTELYDFFRVLFSRIGKTIDPETGAEVKAHQVSDVVNFISEQKEGSTIYITYPLHIYKNQTIQQGFELLQQKGYARILNATGEAFLIDELLEQKVLPEQIEGIQVVVDRLKVRLESLEGNRLAESIQTAWHEGRQHCDVWNGIEFTHFSSSFSSNGIEFQKPYEQLFNANHPSGACRNCDGYGTVLGLDEKKIIPDKSLSVYDGAVACWAGDKMSVWKDEFIASAINYDFPIHRAIEDLTEEEIKLLWGGTDGTDGIDAFFEELEKKSYKIQNRVLLSRYRGRTICPDCSGTRITKAATYVKIQGASILDILQLPIDELVDWKASLTLTEREHEAADIVLIEIEKRLKTLCEVGLQYLTLGRQANTLSGGESQRINLTKTLSSNLTGSLYVLDEPSIGLHSKDTKKLIGVLQRLRDLGNTVVVVEHDEDIMRSADYIIDMGPFAGTNGGTVTAKGTPEELLGNQASLTAKYLNLEKKVYYSSQKRKLHNSLTIKGVNKHNLKQVDATIPLNGVVCITGPSGSGKSTLIKEALLPLVLNHFAEYKTEIDGVKEISGDFSVIKGVENIDQNPIGKSSRSNPVTYVKAYDHIRKVFADTTLAKAHKLTPKHFSFNVAAGRCENCSGEGIITVDMQFLADVNLTCEECKGQRFQSHVLDVTYQTKNIYDVLEMTVSEAIQFFSKEPKIADALQPLEDVGLGYVHLGQSSSTLSGGEAQRVKLASYLGKGGSSDPLLFLFDEPTTGLHFEDINKLLYCFNALVEKGHSVVVIEHQPDVIVASDYILELGPGSGKYGGEIVFEGTPEQLADADAPSSEFIKEKLNAHFG